MPIAQTHEWMFYEVAWRSRAQGLLTPTPWWVQQAFRRWFDSFDGGLFETKEAAFASNAHYRYWNMVGVKDHHQETLIGQAGEVEPVYDKYALSFFLFDPGPRALHLPQIPVPDGNRAGLDQEIEAGYLPVLRSTYRSPVGVQVRQGVLATTLGLRQRSVVLDRLVVDSDSPRPRQIWLCAAVQPAGPTGFQRHYRGQGPQDRRIGFLRYVPADRRVEVNSAWGPVFGRAPAHFGCYGNAAGSFDPEHYLAENPFADLARAASLNGVDTVTDHVAGLCTAVFAWPLTLTDAEPTFGLDVLLPVDDYRGADDLAELHGALQGSAPDDLETANRNFWTGKLDGDGLQTALPPLVSHLFDLFRVCRANLLMLADSGAIHPGPTIYDSFWVRDSSVEGVACALAGDGGLAERQFGDHYPRVFNTGSERLGPGGVVSAFGFFGGEHEKNDHEWDSNGQALWAFGRFDRILGPAGAFGARVFSPYVVLGARWLRDNRSVYGLLHSGWSAEHLGDRAKPHYWDDLWGVAGLYEAARLAERLAAPETGELWAAYADLARATRDSILWVLGEQRQRGHWETFIPTGPADVGLLDSTMIGAVAYFHPCRLYMGHKLGPEVDFAARMTLETIWAHFVRGGFEHLSAWNAYGPYLTLHLAHAFLLVGEVERMDALLAWTVGNAAYPKVSRNDNDRSHPWDVALGAWNEQHCHPIATDFAELRLPWWYMGDMPHGWAAAEFNLLLRDILFFEADEDGQPHVYVAPGVRPHWVGDGQSVSVSRAPTIFGGRFGYRMTHDAGARRLDLEITQPLPPGVSYVWPCQFGSRVSSATADGNPVGVSGRDVRLPAGTSRASIFYSP